MSKKIKSTFIKITTEPIRVIKGRFGYHTNIKDIYVVNNSTANSFLSVYILDKDLIKTYICNNISIPANKRFEIPHDGNIEIEDKEHIIAETKKTTNLDVFCNYIETVKVISTIEIQFQDQNGLSVTDINYSIINTNSSNKKIIRFGNNSKYTQIPDILYEINGSTVIIYKTPNLKIPIHDFKEFTDRYELDFYAIKDNMLFSNFFTQSLINISFNISDVSQWRYNNIDSFDDTVVWLDTDINVPVIADSYYLNFKDIIGYTTPSNFLFKIYPDNLINLNLEYISNTGTFKILTDYNVSNLTWRLITDFSGEDLSDDYYLSSLVILEEGIHTIKIDGLDGVFETTEYQFHINKNQSHYLKHFVTPVEAQVQIDLDIMSTSTMWEIDGIWYTTSDIVTITDGTYSINYIDVDGYDKPSSQEIILSNNLKTVVSNKYTSQSGQVSISKPSLLDNSISKGIKWRVINKLTQEKSNWFTYDIEHTVINGEYDIEFQSIEDYFDSFTAPLIVYKSQKTIYIMNNSILN